MLCYVFQYHINKNFNVNVEMTKYEATGADNRSQT